MKYSIGDILISNGYQLKEGRLSQNYQKGERIELINIYQSADIEKGGIGEKWYVHNIDYVGDNRNEENNVLSTEYLDKYFEKMSHSKTIDEYWLRNVYSFFNSETDKKDIIARAKKTFSSSFEDEQVIDKAYKLHGEGKSEDEVVDIINKKKPNKLKDESYERMIKSPAMKKLAKDLEASHKKDNPISLEKVQEIYNHIKSERDSGKDIFADNYPQFKDTFNVSSKIIESIIMGQDEGKNPEQIHSEIESEYKQMKSKPITLGDIYDITEYLEIKGQIQEGKETERTPVIKKFPYISKEILDKITKLWQQGKTPEQIHSEIESEYHSEEDTKYAVIDIANTYATVKIDTLKGDEKTVRLGVSLEEANRVVTEHFEDINKPKQKRYERNIERLKDTEGLSFYEKELATFKKSYGAVLLGRSDIISISIEIIKLHIEKEGGVISKENIKLEMSSWIDYLMKDE